jgi:phosphonate transport system substrate-binding protein
LAGLPDCRLASLLAWQPGTAGQNADRADSMFRRRFTRLALAAAATPGLAVPTRAHAQSWKSQIKEFRLGLLGGENTQDRLARYDGFQYLLQQALGVPVKLFPAADYAGVMQAIAAGQLEAAEFSPSAFAGAWLDCKCI